MKLGIMQPYFFPYLGHFALIASVDQWVVFDITQYTPKSWINRNRILHPNSGWQYVSVPLSNSSISIKTYEAKILDCDKAKSLVVGKLSHYKNKAPYYESVLALVNEVFNSCPDDSLVNLNVRGLVSVCGYLGLPFKYRIASKLDLSFPPKLKPGDWALEICDQLNASSYINPNSGKDIFSREAFALRNIAINFIDPLQYSYETAPYQFESNLSILDVLMWNAPVEVAEAIKNRKICTDLNLGGQSK